MFSFHITQPCETMFRESGFDICLFFLLILLFNYKNTALYVQSTLVISNSKGLSEILRDILTSTYQVCRIKEK